MREIKFRGKRVDNSEWVFGDIVRWRNEEGYVNIIDERFGCCIDHEGNLILIEAPFVVRVIPETVGQYTGMIDRNSKEVYEGDIITVLQTDEELFIRLHEVKFLNGRWAYQKLYGDYEIEGLGDLFSFMPTVCINKGLMVIGNIHENPDLLGGDKQ